MENNCFKLKVSKFILVKAKSVKRIQKFSCLLSIRGVEKGGGRGKTPDLPALVNPKGEVSGRAGQASASRAT